MKIPRSRFVLLFTAVQLAASFQLLMAAESAPARKLLKGHVAKEVAHLQPIERLPATTNLYLAIGLPLRDPQGLTNFLQQLYDPASTNYHHYLSSEEFTERFGPTQKVYETVKTFLQTNGFKVVGTHSNRVV